MRNRSARQALREVSGVSEGRERRARLGRKHGVTLVEVLISMAVAAIGISGAAGLVMASSNVVRHTQVRNQAQELARRQLESIVAQGCNADPATWCSNIQALDGQTSNVWLATDSSLITTAPGVPDASKRQYTIEVDVDPPYEGNERGFPRIDRSLDGAGNHGAVVNVRVTVSWTEPNRGKEAVVLQTRMSP